MQFLEIGWFEGTWREFMAVLCKLIYQLISGAYNLFMDITKVPILSSEQTQPIYQRVTLILTIVMVFYVTFEFVKFIVQPDGITDKEKGVGKLSYKMILVVVLIAFVPRIFTWAIELQTAVVDKGIIGKVIVGNNVTDPDKFGSTFSAQLFSLFYYPEDGQEEEDCDGIKCSTLVGMNVGMLSERGELVYLTKGLRESATVETNIEGEKAKIARIHFEGLLAVIVGGFVLYMLALYCVDVGVRWAQLVFLQVIAPIPIIGYLSPKKDGIFQKWCKQCLTTYLDLFIRIAIIYFILLLCSILLQSKIYIIDSKSPTLVYIALIMGVLLFAKKAPEMLKELFPKSNAASGNFGLKAADRVAPMAARAIGGGLGGASRLVGGAIAAARNRHIRNKANGAKSGLTKEGKEQREARKTHRTDSKNKAAVAKQSGKKAVSAAEDARRVAAEKQKVQNAKRELDAAKLSKDKTRIAAAEAKLKAASKDYREFTRQRMDTEEMRAKKSAITNGIDQTKMKNARTNLKDAKQELDDAKKSNDQTRIAAAESKMKDAKKDWSDLFKDKKTDISDYGTRASADKYQEKTELDYLNKQSAAAEAANKVAEDQNTKYRSAVVAGVGGAISGAYHGIKSGVQATKISEIPTKIKEGVKEDIAHQQAINKYYDEGGTGFWDRTVTQAYKKIGADTPYTEIQLTNQALDRKIKEYEGSISRADNVKKEFDATEDRIKGKLDESKVRITSAEDAKIKTGLKRINSEGKEEDIYAEVATGESVAEINRKYKRRAKTANDESEHATKMKEEHANKYAQLLNQKRENVAPDKLSEYDAAQIEMQRLEKIAAEKAKAASDADFAATQVEKNAARYIFTQMLNNPKAQEYDKVAMQRLEDEITNIKIANQDIAIRNKLEKKLSQKDFAAFISCKFEDYDQLDRVISSMTNARNEIARDKQVDQDQKTRNETSTTTQAKKAADDYTGGNK